MFVEKILDAREHRRLISLSLRSAGGGGGMAASEGGQSFLQSTSNTNQPWS